MFEKYLITGATGFLGRTVLAQLRDAKAEIRALVTCATKPRSDASSRARMSIPASFTARG